VGRNTRDRVRSEIPVAPPAALIISNMMMGHAAAYNAYAQEVLMPGIDPAVLAEIKRIEEAEQYEGPALYGTTRSAITMSTTSSG